MPQVMDIRQNKMDMGRIRGGQNTSRKLISSSKEELYMFFLHSYSHTTKKRLERGGWRRKGHIVEVTR
jgi:hypothetical protein